MICVDTSVWVSALRDRAGPDGRHLSALLDTDEVAIPAPVRIEVLSGASRPERERLRISLSALPILLPGAQTWSRMDGWIDRAGEAGERFGFADLLIAAIAVDHDAALWSKDRDFQRMQRIGILKLHDAG
jgi:predicted nucleic acid-binding protein